MAVDINAAAEHLNTLTEDYGVLERLIEAAQSHLESQLGYTIAVRYPEGAPPAIDQAILMLVGHWYENREASLVGTNAEAVPFGFEEIVNNHRDWSWT